jgi:serine/threonine protein kinase
MIIDLRPYGLAWEIDTEKEFYIPEDLNEGMIAKIAAKYINGEKLPIPIKGTFFSLLENTPSTFNFGKELGHGSYGRTYTISKNSIDEEDIVCKVLYRKDVEAARAAASAEGAARAAAAGVEAARGTHWAAEWAEKAAEAAARASAARAAAAAADREKLEATISEFLIQLIIAEDTKDIQQDTTLPEGIKDAIKEGKIVGPFVPYVRRFAIDKDFIYIVSEAMETTVEQKIGAGPTAGPPPAGTMVDIIIQLSGILYILHKKEHFNHRDLKADNIMMKQNKVRLIDFGFSCLEHERLQLNASNGSRFRVCDKLDRDMSSFFFELLLFNYKDPKIPLGQIMRRLLGATPAKWLEQYEFYNQSPGNELMTAKFIFDLFKNAKIDNPKDPYSKIDVEIGLNLPSYGDGNTRLHKAAEQGDLGTIKRLLTMPELKTKTLNDAGLTAYHVAALKNVDKEIFDVLIKHNPSLASKKTPEGQTADQLVTNDELRKYLVSKMSFLPLRNTDKKWFGKTRKDLKRRRRTMRKKYTI